jgi:hypothetical protein
MAGKGDTPRPVDLKAYESNYERIWARSTAEQRDAEVNESGVICSEQKATKLVEDSSSQEEQTLQM